MLREAFGREVSGGNDVAAYMLEFALQGDTFRVVWPVLPTRTATEAQARRQAATMLHRDIKARLVSALVKGARVAMFAYLVLPNGRTAAEASVGTLMDGVPPVIALPPRVGTEGEGSG